MFIKAFKIFFKIKTCFVTFLLAFIGVVGFCGYRQISSVMYIRGSSPIDICRRSMEFAAIVFILFLFISFEYFLSLKKSNISECLDCMPKGKGFKLSMFLTLEMLALVTTLAMLAIALLTMYINGVGDLSFIIYTVKLYFINFIICDTIAILFGYLYSNIKSNVVSYAAIIMTAIAFSPIFLSLGDIITHISNKYVNPFFYMFSIFPQDFTDSNYDFYGFPLNTHNYALILFWISLLMLILLLSSKTGSKVRLGLISIALLSTIISGVYVNLPHSEYYSHTDDIKNGPFEGVYYYEYSDNPKNTPMQYDEEADFNIVSMNIDMAINRQLEAKVKIAPDNFNLKNYKFTLYHGYKIKSITDSDGNSLNYVRDSDYLLVNANEQTGIGSGIIIEYKGYHPIFVSNSQGSYLPAGFAYYPINGYHYIYDITSQRYMRSLFPSPVDITLNIDTDKTVYSNLQRVEDNSFKGKSDALTIVSGFIKEKEIAGCRVIYTYLDPSEYGGNLGDMDNFFDNQLPDIINSNKSLYENKTLIQSANVTLGSEYEYKFVCSDHIIFDSPYYLENAQSYSPNSKEFLDVYYELLKLNSNEKTDKTDLDYVLESKIEEYGFEDSIMWLEMHSGELAENDAMEIAQMIGGNTELDLCYEEYEKEVFYNAEN